MIEIKLIKTEAGEFLTRQQVIDRLCQYDVCMLMRNINLEDYSWLSDTREHETIPLQIESGQLRQLILHRGFQQRPSI